VQLYRVVSSIASPIGLHPHNTARLDGALQHALIRTVKQTRNNSSGWVLTSWSRGLASQEIASFSQQKVHYRVHKRRHRTSFLKANNIDSRRR
jgi:hypothetical protein